MSSIRKKYLRFQVYLILKGFSIIGVLSVFGSCRHQGGSAIQANIPAEKKLTESVLQVDTLPVVNEQVQINTPQEPVYEPSIEVICDYGVISPPMVIEPPESSPKKYGVRPDIDNN